MISVVNLLLTFSKFCIVFSSSKEPFYPLSDKYISEINRKQSTWIAGPNFNANTSLSEIKHLFGVIRHSSQALPIKYHEKHYEDIPDFFDARKQWKECKSISVIRDQSNCGSCWAFGATEAMSDRICIHSKGKKQVMVSSQDLLTCCKSCGWGCLGGEPDLAWKYWNTTGIVTGGEFNSSMGCRSYTFPPCEHFTNGNRSKCIGITPFTPKCIKHCDANSSKNYAKNLTFGNEPYKIEKDERQIQLEVMKNGPIEVTFVVFADFLSYKNGVYKRTSWLPLGGHAVKLIGWGIDNGTPYWLLANSWNTDWGDHGFFKFLRGVNHCEIENDAVAGLPK